MRHLYSLFTYLLTPALLVYFTIRGTSDRGWLKRWSERFGEFDATGHMQGIVVHAASVGEVNAAAPLIRALKERWPDYPLTVTCFTATGSRRINAVFGDSVHHLYAPVDTPGSVRRFLNGLKPRLLVIMETEIWPNLFYKSNNAGIPILVSNARLTERSASGWSRFAGLAKIALQCPRLIAAQTNEDRQRFISLGANQDTTRVFGNLKFDIDLAPDLTRRGRSIRNSWGSNRLVMVAGSTHEDDETALFVAFRNLLGVDPTALLVLVPRYPERFERVAQSSASAGFKTARRSDGRNPGADIQCLVVDEMGVLLEYYAACDIAFLGGTLADVGGHNPLEAAALGRPIIMGPNTAHIRQTAEQLLKANAAITAENAEALFNAWKDLQSNQERREKMGRAAHQLVQQQRGAVKQNLEAVKALLLQ